MTLEELKAEADKFGYKLIKKPKPMPPLAKCCGVKPEVWFVSGDYGYNEVQCPKCGADVSATTERDARLAWNRMIQEAKDGKREISRRNYGDSIRARVY